MLAKNLRHALALSALLAVGASIAYAATPGTIYEYDGAGNMTRASTTATDPKNCGGAANVCSAGTTCCQGACASCTDGTRNCTESDVDCGGWCSKCVNGKHCNAAADCASGSCSPATSLCAAPP